MSKFGSRNIFSISVLVILFVSVLRVDCAIDTETYIVNGQDADIRDHPYVVSVRHKACSTCPFEHVCGGTIFNEDVIITAADCVRSAETHELLIVGGSRFRTGSLQDGGMIFPVAKIILHKDSTINLALLRLSLKISFDLSLAIQPVSFATSVPAAGTVAVIVGWGATEEGGDSSEYLLEAEVPIVDHNVCKGIFEFQTIQDYEICAGFTTGGTDSCQGDGGGPLLVDNRLIGVTSWGIGCARPNSPGVYTNVVQLRQWIENEALGIHISFL